MWFTTHTMYVQGIISDKDVVIKASNTAHSISGDAV